MKTHHGIAIALFSAFLSACEHRQETAGSATVASAASPAAATAPSFAVSNTNPDLYPGNPANLIKTADYRLEVENVEKSIASIEVAIRKHGAFTGTSELRLGDAFPKCKMTIRVPCDSFNDLLKDIDKEARVIDSRDIRTEDVSRQFVDLESRLKTKREVEQRYMDILRRNAGTIEELLQAEKQIGQLHEDIEATISRVNFLKDEVRYSTIHLELYQQPKTVVAVAPSHVLADMQEALASGWQGLLAVIVWMLYLWPVAVLGPLFIVLIRVIKRWQRNLKGYHKAI